MPQPYVSTDPNFGLDEPPAASRRYVSTDPNFGAKSKFQQLQQFGFGFFEPFRRTGREVQELGRLALDVGGHLASRRALPTIVGGLRGIGESFVERARAARSVVPHPIETARGLFGTGEEAYQAIQALPPAARYGRYTGEIAQLVAGGEAGHGLKVGFRALRSAVPLARVAKVTPPAILPSGRRLATALEREAGQGTVRVPETLPSAIEPLTLRRLPTAVEYEALRGPLDVRTAEAVYSGVRSPESREIEAIVHRATERAAARDAARAAKQAERAAAEAEQATLRQAEAARAQRLADTPPPGMRRATALERDAGARFVPISPNAPRPPISDLPPVEPLDDMTVAEARRFYGAKTTALNLGRTGKAGEASVRREAPGPSRVPLAEEIGPGFQRRAGRRGTAAEQGPSIEGLDSAYRRLLSDPSGRISPEVALALAGGGGGAAVGAAAGGDTLSERIAGAIGMGLIGTRLRRLARGPAAPWQPTPYRFDPKARKMIPVEAAPRAQMGLINQLRSQGLLTGAAIPKNILGGLGAVEQAAVEAGSIQPILQALRPIKTAKSFVRGVRQPIDIGIAGNPRLPWWALPGRAVSGVDQAFMDALERGGVSAADIERFMLRRPTGEALLSPSMTRLLQTPVGRTAVLFQRTPANVYRGGIEELSALLSPRRLGDIAGPTIGRALTRRRLLTALTIAGGAGAAKATERMPPARRQLVLALLLASQGIRGMPFGIGAIAGGSPGALRGLAPLPEFGLDPRQVIDPREWVALPRFLRQLQGRER